MTTKWKTSSIAGLLVIVLACADLAANEYDLGPIVADLHERVAALECENRQLRALTGSRLDARDNRRNHQILFSGRIHVDYWAFPVDSPGINAFESGSASISPQDRLELRRARFAAEGMLPANIIYKLDFELSEASNPEFRDLYVGWDEVPIFRKLLFGNQKRPYGLDHLNSSNLNIFMERPLIIQAFNRNNRRFGLAAYGVTDDEAWNWRYGMFNLAEIQDDGVFVSDHYQLEMAGRLARTVFDACDESRYLHLAIASNYAEPDGSPTPGREANQARFETEPEARTESRWLDTRVIDGAQFFGILALECVANLGRLQFTAEYQNLWLNRTTGFGETLYFHGGYAQLSCFLTEHFQPWNRRLGIIDRVSVLGEPGRQSCGFGQALQLAVRVSLADLSDNDIAGGVGETIAAGLNWYWSPRARLQFNCVYGDISNRFAVDGFTSGTFLTLGTRVMVDF